MTRDRVIHRPPAPASGPVLANRPVEAGKSTSTPFRRRRRTFGMLVASIPLMLFVLAAVVGPMVVVYDPITTHTGERLKSPGAALSDGSIALLGTDQVGRDLLAQVLQGARISLLVAAGTVFAAGLIGLVVGVLAGYYGGVLDTVAMRLADIQLGFPTILLAILIAAMLGPSVTNVIITLSIARWVTFGRVARASTLSAREREFVLAARALGASDWRLLLRHVVPTTLTPLIVIATVEMGLVIISEASLSFLGLGTPPDQPSWGLIVANGRAYLNTAWWISTMPGLALSMVVLAVGLFGDRVRDYLDPRSAVATSAR
jgi:peptide/nickel transport system permease protein